MFDNRIVWLFREPRSGSTWLSVYLANKLGRKWHMTDDKTLLEQESAELFQNPEDERLVLSTHSFGLLSSMKNYDNPILIRCYRKNVFEQFLSTVVTEHTKFHNIVNGLGNRKFELIIQELEKNQLHIKKSRLEDYIMAKKSWNEYWNRYATLYEHYDVCYEDLVAGCELFDFGKVTMSNHTKSLPKNYKSRVFVNYNEIKEWCDQLSEDNGLT